MRPAFIFLTALLFSPTAIAEDPIGFLNPNLAKAVPAEIATMYLAPGNFVEGKDYQAIQADLNGDGKPEFIHVIRSFCGTGGCPFEIFDGATKRGVGVVSGNPIWVFRTEINGWPVISAYSHGSATSGAYTSFVFNGSKYVEVASVILYGKSVTELFEKRQKVPIFK